MCTNDLYLCKDSSRINCTLACSTLGYIPCRNYVDKKICSSVNKKSALSSLGGGHANGDRFFGLKTAASSSYRSAFGFLFDKDTPSSDHGFTDTTLALTLFGLFLFGVIIAGLVLFCLVARNRKNKQRKKKTCSSSSSDDANMTNRTNGHRRSGGGDGGAIFHSASTSLSSSQTLFDDVAKNYSSLCRNLRLTADEPLDDSADLRLPSNLPCSHQNVKSELCFNVSPIFFLFSL